MAVLGMIDLLLPLIGRRINASRRRRPESVAAWHGLDPLEPRLMLSAPTASLTAPDITAPGATVYQFKVDYTDPDGGGIDVSTLGNGNVEVTGPAAFDQLATFVGVDDDSNGTPREATYQIAAPDGTFGAADNGVYSVAVEPNQVSSVESEFVAAGSLGTFNVNVAADTTAPTASLTAADLTAAGQDSYQFTVTYSDDVAVNVATLGNSNVEVTGPNAFDQLATFVSVDNDTDGTPRTATYQIAGPGPGGAFTSTANGAYTVTLGDSQVSDTSGNFAPAGSLGTFNVNVAADTTAPTASLTAADLTTAGQDSYQFIVTYSDDVAVNVATLGNSNVEVTGPNGFDQLATFVSVDTDTDGTPRTATYQIAGAGPGGALTSTANGAYTVTLGDSQVSDTSGNFAPAGSLGTFNVNVAADTTAPTASLTAADLTAAAQDSYQFTVTYSDDVAVNVATLGNSNVEVTGPNGFDQLATFVSVDTDTDGTPRTATYQIAGPGPGGAFTSTANGAYTVTLGDSQVSDTSGNFAPAGSLGTFNVNVAADITPPTASLTAADLTAAAQDSYQFTVTYSDDVAVNVATLGNSNVEVTGPNGYDQLATFVSVDTDTNGTPRTATYQIAGPGPGGAFTSTANGAYTVTLGDSPVSDTSGNFVAAGSLGTFNVNVAADTTAPTASLTAADLTAAGQDSYQFTVTYSDDVAVNVATLGNSNVEVTGPNGFDQLATFVNVENDTNGTPRTATYQITAPNVTFGAADDGAYTVTLAADQVADTSGNFAPAGSLGTFNVNVADTTSPTASLTAADITTAGAATYQFTVTYSDDVAVNVATLGNSNVEVTGPNGFDQLATFVSVDNDTDGTPRTATYQITAPDGTFGAADDGAYTVTLAADQVADTSGNFAPGGSLGTFNVNVAADITPPTASLTAADLTAAGQDSYQFTVTYSDDVAVNVATLGNSNVEVTGPNGFDQLATFVSVDTDTDGTPRTATYQIAGPGPGGAFTSTANGAYTVTLGDSQVSDTSGNFAPAGSLGTFNVNVAADTTAPTASLTAADLTAAGQDSYQFTVTYSDDVAVNVATLSNDNVEVTGPNGYDQLATFVSVDTDTNGTPRTATYQITVPDGTFGVADDGAYTVTLAADQVADTSGNFAPAGSLGTFNVNVAADTTAPTASLTAADLTAAGQDSYQFTVTYSDDVAVNVATLGNSNVEVTGPNGFDQFATFVSVDNDTNGTPRTATYQITAPNVTFGAADDGAYTVTLAADQVADTSGNLAPAGSLGTFNVNVADTTSPTASLAAADITTAGVATYQFTVTYSDDVAVNVATLGNSNVEVTGPNGFDQLATFVNVENDTNGTPRTATYQITVPDGTFGVADDGAYTVTLGADQVSDTSGNFAPAGSLGTFNVNVAADTTAPTASLTAADLTAAGQDSYQFTVTYSDDVAVNVATLGNGNVEVTGPNGFDQFATFVSVDNNTDGTPRTATYQITAPNVTFGAADDGAYTVTLGADQVSDTSGNFAPAGSLGTFNVNVADTTSPTASLAAADITTAGAATYQFTVTYSDDVAVNVATLGNSNVEVTGPDGYDQLATFVSVDNDTNGTPRTATYQITAPNVTFGAADDGTYTVTLGADQVSDTSGNFAAAGSLGTFSVDIAAPVPSLFGNVNGKNVKLTMADRDGTLVTFALTGPGTGSVLTDSVGFIVGFTGTTSTTKATVTTKKSSTPGDDGRTILESVTVGNGSDAASLGAFTATTSDLRGPMVVDGTLGTLSLGNLYDNASLSVLDQAGAGTVVSSIKLGVVADGSITSTVPIKTLSVVAWDDYAGTSEQVSAPAIQTLTSGGDFNASLTLGATGATDLGSMKVKGTMSNAVLDSAGAVGTLTAAAVQGGSISAVSLQTLTVTGGFSANVTLTGSAITALNKLTIGGLVDGSTFRVAGNAGTVSIGAMRDSAFYVGVSDDAVGLPTADQIVGARSITSFTIKGLKTEADSFVDSFIAAADITKISLTAVDVDNGGDPFGVEADEVGSYSRTGVTLKNLVQPGVYDALADYILRIV